MFDGLFGKSPKKKLVAAIDQGDVEALKTLLGERGVSVNDHLPVDYSSRPLHLAVIKNKAPLVEYLISVGAGLDLADGQGWTALDEAVRTSMAEPARILIEAGARLSKKSLGDLKKVVRSIPQAYLVTLAADAIDRNRIDDVFDLLQNGLDANSQLPGPGGRRLVHVAAAMSERLTKELIRRTVDINVLDGEGRSPMDLAVGNGWKKSVALLRMHGAAPVRCRVADVEALVAGPVAPPVPFSPDREEVVLDRVVAGCQLTEAFNFSTRMVARVVRDEKKIVLFDEMPFDEFKNRARLREAFEEYKARGGKADESILTSSYDDRRKEPLIRKL